MNALNTQQEGKGAVSAKSNTGSESGGKDSLCLAASVRKAAEELKKRLSSSDSSAFACKDPTTVRSYIDSIFVLLLLCSNALLPSHDPHDDGPFVTLMAHL